MAPKDTPSTLGFLFIDIARLLRRNLDRRLQALGLTQAQWRAIARLAREEGMTQVDLAESLETQPITVTRLVDRMEKAGWVERRPHPHDRRAVRLFLTPRSQPILAEMQARGADTMSDATRGVAVGAQKELLETLDQIKQNLTAADSAALAPAITGIADGRRRPAKARAAR
jgi:DNA-binding MarR family transcriptional regulator